MYFFENMWKVLHPLNHFQIILAFKDHSAVAGLAYLKFKKRISTEFAGWDIRFRSSKPNHFLYWEAIKIACSEGYKIFDFGRTSPDNSGLMAFKRHWGTIETDLPKFYLPKKACTNAQILPRFGQTTTLSKILQP